jgi:hypothetical protein
MKPFLLPLAGLLFAAAPETLADDAVRPLYREELHAAVTDVPVIVDMSYADPKTWHSAPAAAEVEDPSKGLGCIDAEACTLTIIATR